VRGVFLIWRRYNEKMPSVKLNEPLESLYGVGPKFAERLKKFGIKSVRDLLWHFPFRYDDFSSVSKIVDLKVGQIATVSGVISQVKLHRTWKKRMFIVEALISDDSGSIKAIWFNQRFLLSILKKGKLVSLAGKVAEDQKGGIVLQHPTFELLAQSRINSDQTQIDSDTKINNLSDQSRNQSLSELRHTGRLVPIYPETRKLTSKGFRYLIKPLLESVEKIDDPIPDGVLEIAGFPEINEAILNIHFPETLRQAQDAKKRFAFEDLFLLQLANLRQKLKLAKEKAQALDIKEKRINSLLLELPFSLTESQKKSLQEILEDLKKPHPMNRLLQGDVGSGKTIVAAVAALIAAENGSQAAFMAPTEVLARQHFQTFKKFFKNFDGGVALLVSSECLVFYGDGLESEVKKPDLLKKISSGEIKIIIGTHALIQKGIKFKELALIVIDEQHRFGVNQRAALARGLTQISTQINSDNKENEEFLYSDLTYKIRGAIFEVYNNLGPGFKEITYQKALGDEFEKKGLKFEREKNLKVFYKNKSVGDYKPDFIVDGKVIIEIKSLPFIGKIEEKQLWSYLKSSDYKLGLLVNFGSSQLQIKRIVYDKNYQSKSEFDQSKSEFELPHFLSMSATPIPRTLSLTVFGDLNLSIIDELPKGRKEIITKIVAPDNRDKAYAFIRGQVKKGRQAFVICPRIDSDTLINTDEGRINTDTNNISINPQYQYKSVLLWQTKAAKEEYEKLSKKVFPDLRVGLLHGKLKAGEKTSVMGDFKKGEIDVLVSTSVVEVGVDVPNATIMMIEGSERFGLAQLYQFRGRVGRGEHQSFCFLFSESSSQTTLNRLNSLIDAKSGFELAEKDLEIRGPGEFLGQSQTGLPDLAMKSIQDAALVKSAREAAEKVLESDPDLAKYPALLARVEGFAKEIHLE